MKPMLHLPLRMPLRRPSQGFTLIELVVVLAIVAILALAAQPLHELTLRRSQEATLRHALRELRQAIDEHRAAVVRRAIAPGADATVYPPTLQALVAGVPLIDEQGRPRDDARLYLLRRLPRDPFADPAVPAAETWGLRASSSPPDGPEAGTDVFDVYSRSTLVALDGTRYRDW